MSRGWLVAILVVLLGCMYVMSYTLTKATGPAQDDAEHKKQEANARKMSQHA